MLEKSDILLRHFCIIIWIYLEDLKSGYIEDANEGRSLSLSAVQGSVDPVDQPPEQTLICCLRQRFNGKVSLEQETYMIHYIVMMQKNFVYLDFMWQTNTKPWRTRKHSIKVGDPLLMWTFLPTCKNEMCQTSSWLVWVNGKMVWSK